MDDVYGAAYTIDPLYWGGEAQERPIEIFLQGHEIGKVGISVRNGAGQIVKLDLPREIDYSINHKHLLWRAKTDEKFATGSLILQDFSPFSEAPLGQTRVLFAPKDGQSVAQFSLLKSWAVFVVSDRMVPKLYLLDLTDPKAEPQALDLPDGLQTIRFRGLDADLTLGEEILTVTGEGFLTRPAPTGSTFATMQRRHSWN